MRYSKFYRYGMVGLNLLCLVLVVVFASLSTAQEKRLELLIPTGVFLLGLLATYYLIYHKTGVWKFVHKRAEELDERELTLSRRSTDWAYRWYTVISLLVFFAMGYSVIMPCLNIDMVFYGKAFRFALVGMIYLAHLLPGASVVLHEEYLDFDGKGNSE